MNKTMEIGKTSTIGSFHLFLGKTLSTLILAVGTIILSALILESDYGLYAIALIPSTTFMLFQDWGVTTALIQRCASFRVTNRTADLRKTILAGLAFELLTASCLTIASVVLASFIAINIFDNPESSYLIAFASVTIFSTAIAGVAQSVFVGFEKMKIVGFMLICQALLQGVSAPILVYMGYGAFGALLGFTLASLITSMIAFVTLYFSILRNMEKTKIRISDFASSLKPLLKYGVPFAIGTILAGALTQIYSNMMASYVKDLTLIGNYRVATNFTVLLSFLTFPLTTVLFPAFAKLNPKTEPEIIKLVFASSVKYLSLLLVPATMSIVILSAPLIGTLYGDKWLHAAQFLGIAVLPNLLVVFGGIILGVFLSALGETGLLMKTNLVSLVVGIPLAYVLIPSLGINGVIIGQLISGTPSLIICSYLAWKKYGTKADMFNSLRILLTSALAAGSVFLSLRIFSSSYWLELTVGVVIFFSIYIVLLPLVGAVSQADMINLRTMFGEISFVSRLLNIPLAILERLLNLISNKKEKHFPK